MRRRRLLTIAGTTVLVPSGGCLDSGSDPEPDADTDESDPEPDTDTDESDPEPDDDNGTSSGDKPTDVDGSEWPSEPYADYEATQVYVRTSAGDVLGVVTAAVATTSDQRFLGLSDAESLPEDGGMLFVFDGPDDRTFVMREMDFGIDIVYADEDGTITTIHHAPRPGPNEDGNEQRYPGYGQYVLEVQYRWTERHGVEEGDNIDFEL